MASSPEKPVLLVDDNPDDRLLMLEACKAAGLQPPIVPLDSGQQLIEYLSGKGPFADREKFPLPCLVLLDIKMPVMNGLEVLEWLRRAPEWRALPVLMLTASIQPGDVRQAYQLGANSFHVKPSRARELIQLAAAIKGYWLGVTELPECPPGR